MDTLELDFGPGRLVFRLPMKQICEVERLCGEAGKSIVTMYEEMSAGIGIGRDDGETRFLGAGPVRIKDVFEVIRCAAIGGGMAPVEASRLVAEYVDGRPYAETVPVAWAILHHTIMDVRPKKKAEGQAESTAPMNAEA